jgi:hypothetical protein
MSKSTRPEAPDLKKILTSPTYLLAERDIALLARPELRSVRMQLEIIKPELVLDEHRVHSTIVVFGATRIVEEAEAKRRLQAAKELLVKDPKSTVAKRAVARAERVLAKSHYYDAARKFGSLVSAACQDGDRDYVITTGGGPGIMEGANRGAHDVGAESIGLNITLPEEQRPNPYITPELCFQFHYFGMRKLNFLLRAKALLVFPGGFGTLDELTDALTLRQTGKMQPIPIVMYSRKYWEQVIDFQFLADEGVIADEDLALLSYAETPEEAWEIIQRFHAELRARGKQ